MGEGNTVMTYDIPPFSDDDAPPDNVIWFDAPPTKRGKKTALHTVLKTGSEAELAQRLLSDMGPQAMAHSGLIWALRDDSLWTPVDLPEWKRRLKAYDGMPTDGKPVRVSNAMAKGSWSLALAFCEADTDSIPVGCATPTGFVAVTGRGVNVRPLQPDDRQSVMWPVSYVDDDIAPTWDGCCARWWPHDWEEKQAFIETYAGLCYLGAATRFEKIVLIKGPAGNGKSVLIHALTSFVPAAVRCSVPPDQWTDDHKVLALRGRRINYCTELSDAERIPGERLKAVVSGEDMSARPLYHDTVQFRPTSGHIFASNPWPGVTDRSQGGWDRWAVLPMTERIRDTSVMVDRHTLGARLAREGSVIFSRAIRRASEALALGRLTEPGWSIAAKADWRAHSDPVVSFVSARCERVERVGVSVGAVYQEYRTYSAKVGAVPLGLAKFVERMEWLGFESVRGDSLSHFRLALVPERNG